MLKYGGAGSFMGSIFRCQRSSNIWICKSRTCCSDNMNVGIWVLHSHCVTYCMEEVFCQLSNYIQLDEARSHVQIPRSELEVSITFASRVTHTFFLLQCSVVLLLKITYKWIKLYLLRINNITLNLRAFQMHKWLSQCFPYSTSLIFWWLQA
jgi:hypothetical protein